METLHKIADGAKADRPEGYLLKRERERPNQSSSSFVLPDLATGLKWESSEVYATGIISVAVIPEPGRMMLLALAFSAAVLRRRRSR